MQKLKKFIPILLALVLSFSLFSGFTYAENGAEPMSEETVTFKDNEFTISAEFDSGDDIVFAHKYSGPFEDLFIDGVRSTDVIFDSAYGYSSVHFEDIDDGYHTLTWCTREGDGKYTYYNAYITVGEITSSDDDTEEILVQVFDSKQAPKKMLAQFYIDADTVLSYDNLSNFEDVDDNYNFVAWQYFDSSVNQWVNIKESSMPTIESDMTNYGILEIASVVEAKRFYEVSYQIEKIGLFGIKKYEEYMTRRVEYGYPIPDVTNVFGEYFDGMYLDKDYTNEVRGNDIVKQNTNVYVKINGTLQGKYVRTYYAFDSNGNYVVDTLEFYDEGDDIATLISSPMNRSEYTFTYWTTDLAGKNKADTTSEARKQVNLYAQYSDVDVSDKVSSDDFVGENSTGNSITDVFFGSSDKTSFSILNMYTKINGWWKTSSSFFDSILTILFLLGCVAVIFGIIKYFGKAIFGFLISIPERIGNWISRAFRK